MDTQPAPSSGASPQRAVSDLLPAHTAQAAAANAFTQSLMSPIAALNTVGAQVALCALILGAESRYVRTPRRGRGRRGFILQKRPVPPRDTSTTKVPVVPAGDHLNRNDRHGGAARATNAGAGGCGGGATS
jgi:hypothetical protein